MSGNSGGLKEKTRRYVFRLLMLLQVHRLLMLLRGTNKVAVLCFHRVDDKPSAAYPPLTVAVFEELINYCRKHYRICTIADIEQNRFPNERCLVISFDDAYADFFYHALPILKKYSLPAMLGVVTGCASGTFRIWTQELNDLIDEYYRLNKKLVLEIQGKNFEYNLVDAATVQLCANEVYRALLPCNTAYIQQVLETLRAALPVPPKPTAMMGWPEIIKAAEGNITIASHTHTHCNLTTQTDETVLQEIQTSKQLITEHTGRVCHTIVYPNGMADERVMRLCLKAGYKYLVGVVNCHAGKNQLKGGNYLIPRILIAHNSFEENVFNMEGFHSLLRKA